MLKPLIFILILVTLLAIGLNLGLFDETIEKVNNKSNNLSTEIVPSIENNQNNIETTSKIVKENQNIQQTTQDSNLSKEMMKLLKTASVHFRRSEDNEAFELYNRVIQKTQNSNDPKILKIFAEALFRKAILDNIYPNNDPESAIEDYEKIIKKFNNSDNVELLRLYIKARLKQAKLQSRDELLNTYDELIKRFSKDKEQRFNKDVEELEFAQSFALMKEDKEKAMEVLDNMIAKYQARGDKKLPQTVEYSILNGIELSIITDNDDEKYVNLANKYLSENKDTAPLLDMLKIMKNAQDLDQKDAIDKWMNEHKDYHFPDWDFSDLSEWAENMENPEGKKRIKEYLDIFLKQKYYISSERVDNLKDGDLVFKKDEDGKTTPYIVNTTENSEEQIPQNNEESNNYELEPLDPYNYNTEEPLYPNPYEELEQDPNDGVSHTYKEEDTPY